MARGRSSPRTIIAWNVSELEKYPLFSSVNFRSNLESHTKSTVVISHPLKIAEGGAAGCVFDFNKTKFKMKGEGRASPHLGNHPFPVAFPDFDLVI